MIPNRDDTRPGDRVSSLFARWVRMTSSMATMYKPVLHLVLVAHVSIRSILLYCQCWYYSQEPAHMEAAEILLLSGLYQTIV